MRIHIVGKSSTIETVNDMEKVGTILRCEAVPKRNELEELVKSHASKVMEIFSTDSKTEAVSLKKCSRCVKEGRLGLYPMEDFSLLKNGKRHSQCRVCRAEQAKKWSEKRKEHRRDYHKVYREKHKLELREYAKEYKIRKSVEEAPQKRDDILVAFGEVPF